MLVPAATAADPAAPPAPAPSPAPAPPPSDADWPLDQNTARIRYPNAWTSPGSWQEGDDARLAWIRANAADMTGRVIDALLELPDDVTGTEIAAAAELPGPRALPPVLRALADLCRRVGRQPMWDPHRREGIWRYNIPPVVRSLGET